MTKTFKEFLENLEQEEDLSEGKDYRYAAIVPALQQARKDYEKSQKKENIPINPKTMKALKDTIMSAKKLAVAYEELNKNVKDAPWMIRQTIIRVFPDMEFESGTFD